MTSPKRGIAALVPVGNQVEGKLRVGDRVRVVNNRVYRD